LFRHSGKCTGDACAITFSFKKRSFKKRIQGCITNVEVDEGCFGDGHPKAICVCKTDMCNSRDINVTILTPVRNATCRDPELESYCDSPTCLFTTDPTLDKCRTYDEPTRFHEYIAFFF
ncbi:hypothetical protein PMAYCL1PPCAC_21775, partial [Pristionchus mayeri]